jgi:hypothetical protein
MEEVLRRNGIVSLKRKSLKEEASHFKLFEIRSVEPRLSWPTRIWSWVRFAGVAKRKTPRSRGEGQPDYVVGTVKGTDRQGE